MKMLAPEQNIRSFAAGQDHRAHFGMFEADALQGIVQFDVDAEVVRVELQAVARPYARFLVDVHGERRHRARDVQPPMPVPRWMCLEGHWCIDRLGHRRCGFGHFFHLRT
jgi:hypothetical protein